jgi:hypothetical protein
MQERSRHALDAFAADGAPLEAIKEEVPTTPGDGLVLVDERAWSVLT